MVNMIGTISTKAASFAGSVSMRLPRDADEICEYFTLPLVDGLHARFHSAPKCLICNDETGPDEIYNSQ